MWFNNIVVYQLETPFDRQTEDIHNALEDHSLKPCPPHSRQSQGWINPINELEKKLYSIYGCHIIVAAKEIRLLPSSIIQTVLEEKKNAFELTQKRPMRRAETQQFKEDIEFELLPKAFVLQKKDWLYIDTVKQWVIINATNPNKAAEVISLLIKSLGSLSAIPLAIDANLNDLFNDWLHNPLSLPDGLSLHQNCVLVNRKSDKSQYNCKDIKQNEDEIKTLLEQGYIVSSLELVWFNRIQFTLTDNFMLKRLKCIDYLLDDAFKDNDKLENEQEKFDNNFSLLAGEIRSLLSFLIAICHKKSVNQLSKERANFVDCR